VTKIASYWSWTAGIRFSTLQRVRPYQGCWRPMIGITVVHRAGPNGSS